MTRSSGDEAAVRWQIAKAVRRSDLQPPARLVMWTLLDSADVHTGVIPASHSPSLSTLAKDTGLSRSSVTKHLNELEARGWVDRTPPPVREQVSMRARTQYRVLLPTSPSDALVRDADQCGERTSADDGPVLVRETTRSSPPGGHISDLDPSDRPARARPVANEPWRGRRVLAERIVEFIDDGMTVDEAETALDQLAATKGSASAYVESFIKKGRRVQLGNALRRSGTPTSGPGPAAFNRRTLVNPTGPPASAATRRAVLAQVAQRHEGSTGGEVDAS